MFDGACSSPAADEFFTGVVSTGLAGFTGAGFTGATWLGVLGGCDSSVDERCVLERLSSASLGVDAPGAELGVVFIAGDDVGDGAAPGDAGEPSSWHSPPTVPTTSANSSKKLISS